MASSMHTLLDQPKVRGSAMSGRASRVGEGKSELGCSLLSGQRHVLRLCSEPRCNSCIRRGLNMCGVPNICFGMLHPSSGQLVCFSGATLLSMSQQSNGSVRELTEVTLKVAKGTLDNVKRTLLRHDKPPLKLT